MKPRFLTGVALGYLLGTRPGRERLDQFIGYLRDVGESGIGQQVRGELNKLTGSGRGRSGPPASGVVTPPVIVGPGPEATTQAGGPVDVAVPDVEPSTATAGSPEPDTREQRATRLDPPRDID